MAGGLRQVNYGRRITAVCVWQGVEDGSEAETANWEGRHGRRRQQKSGGEGGGKAFYEVVSCAPKKNLD